MMERVKASTGPGGRGQEASVDYRFVRLLSVILFPAVAAFAQPQINASGVVNSASYRTPGLPASGIAQGSIFTIFGTGLGGSSWVGASAFPLPITLGGTSASVTTGTTQTSVIILGANAYQINAILPSTTPVGAGTITVTYNGQTSPAQPIQVVASTFAMYTYNQSGAGQAVATDTNYQLNTIIHTVHPGDYISLWGTGLGAIDSSDAQPPAGGDLPGSVTVYIGNATVSAPYYHGRAPGYAGLDQVVFQVPDGIEGCYVPVGVDTGAGVGNVATIAVSSSGETCSDSVLGQDLINKLASGQKVDFAYVRLEGDFTAGFIQYGSDVALATFSEIDPGNAGTAEYGVSSGYCYAVDCSQGCLATNGAAYNNVLSDSSPAQLDAGAVSFVAGPEAVTGGATIPLYQSGGFYEDVLSGTTGTRVLWSDLPYQVTGAGGTNVGSFSVTDNTSNATLKFSNVSAAMVVPRSSGLQLQWTGGDATLQNGQVTIGAYSGSSDYKQFQVLQCTAPLSAQGFTIPSWILSTLPASGLFGGQSAEPIGFIWIGQYDTPTIFNATGLDRGIITDILYHEIEVNFQ